MLSPADMIVIGALALLFFGPDQLPKVARNAGKAIRDVQATSQSFIREMERAADEPEHETPRSPWTSPSAAGYYAESASTATEHDAESASTAAERNAEPGSTAAEYHAEPGSTAAEYYAEPGSTAAEYHAEPGSTAAEYRAEPGSTAAEHHAEPGPSIPLNADSNVSIAGDVSDARPKAKGESDSLGSAQGVADVER